MRHRVSGRHLGRDTAHRRSLYRNLITDLFRYERITTTEAKAKEIRPMAEKIVTLGRKGGLHNRRQALRFIFDEKAVKKLFDEIGPRMRQRPGGYLRVTSLEPRKGDGAKMAAIEFVDYVDAPPTPRPQRVTASAAAPGSTTPPPAPGSPPAPLADEAEDETAEDDATVATEADEEATAVDAGVEAGAETPAEDVTGEEPAATAEAEEPVAGVADDETPEDTEAPAEDDEGDRQA
ncbi:MAG: 50S ribosomal protein L17 [Dehalococcoidia bacterium]|nr:50S ribosomal protein L17 [Dehalococcoidia bacterium]